MSMDLCISVFHPRDLPEGLLSNEAFICPLTDGKPYYLLEFPNRNYPGYLAFLSLGGSDCLILSTYYEFNHYMMRLKKELSHDDIVFDDADSVKMGACMCILRHIETDARRWYQENKIVVVGYC